MSKAVTNPRARISLSVFGGDTDPVPSEFRIFALGVNDSEKGSFLLDSEALDAVMANYERHGKALLFDYNHAVTYSQPTPEQTIAAGEFVPEARADGLWATAVKWTDRARAFLAAKEYRFFSPLFEHDPKTGRVLRLINIALTNLPALDNIEPLVAASATTGDAMTEEEIKKLQAQVTALETAVKSKDQQIATLEGKTVTVALATTVGLSASAAETEVRAAVTGLASYRKQTFEVLGVNDEAKAIGALSVMKQTANEAAELRAKVAEIETVALATEWKGFLDGLSTTGKDNKFLTPARRSVVEDLAVKTIGGGTLTPKGVEAGKVAALGMLEAKTGGTYTPAPGSPAISQLQADINARMGIDNAKFAAAQVAGAR